jgi:glycerol-3-phosphate dehydrogenase subunit B
MKQDVIVIGMGLSGLMAAKTAADHGLKTMVLAKGAGMFQVVMGGVDLLGYYPEENPVVLEDVRPGLENLIRAHPDHPYAKVGLEDIEKSLQSFSGLFDPQGYHYTGTPGRNTLLPTGVGSLKPSYLMPSTMSAGAGILSEPTLLVGFQEFGNFYAAYAAQSFRRIGPRNGGLPIRGETIALSDLSDRKAFSPAALAVQLEGEEFRKKLGERIRSIKKGENRIGFPAVLGLKNAEKVKADLEERIGAKVFELPTLPPSIPGMRLFERFKDYLRAKGVRMILGFEVVSAIQKNGRCQGVVLKTPVGERVHEAESFVLAAGGFFGGGLRAQGDRIVEPLFKLPVTQPEAKEAWFQYEFLGRRGHPINKSGIRTNGRLNPLNESGKVPLENLFLAGRILGHHDALREKSLGGVDIATGYKAVRNLLGK